VNRRAFIAGLGGAAAWPLVARAQQPAMPVIGFIGMRTATEGYGSFVQGLSETGFVDHQNVTINYRAAKDADELSAIAVDLTRNKVAVICGPANAIAAAKTATDAIPMVFIGAADPIAAGLVLSFNRLGGNVTGVRLNAGELPEKSLELLHELVPTAKTIGLLINPKFSNAEPDTVVMLRVSGALGIQVIIDRIIAENDLDAAFQRFAQEGVDAVLVNENLFFVSYRDRVASLAIRYNRRSDELWRGCSRRNSSGRNLCGSYSQRRKTCRHAGTAAYEVRLCHQPQDGQSTWADDPGQHPRPRRRGHRMRRRDFIVGLGSAAARPRWRGRSRRYCL
jgi:putative ABC transport system substrate-binding protein